MLELKGTFKRLVQLLSFIWNNCVPESLGLAQGHNKLVGELEFTYSVEQAFTDYLLYFKHCDRC